MEFQLASRVRLTGFLEIAMRQATRNRHVLTGIFGLTLTLIGPMASRSDAQFVPGVGTNGTPFVPGVGTNGTPFTSGSYFGPSYGPFYGGIGTGGYTAGYGIGGLGGYGIGYGRYGGGYGGYGFGYSGFPYSYGYGIGGGYGGLGYNIGMTAADQAMMKYQNYGAEFRPVQLSKRSDDHGCTRRPCCTARRP